ncbi:hypothetical protein [Staphylococcus epidermidis]|uniref:hypothetical protein n=1 Tax=Staphylococcus epidermidis TaxID=1282 RepID=UPI00241CAAD7|nr:hypothetical protein [Staphylococcus epidermidis]MDK7943839.1 hypothetical protein [Staphylococcus epidermidis]
MLKLYYKINFATEPLKPYKVYVNIMAFTFNNFKGVNDNSSDKQVNKFYKEAIKSIRDSGDKHIIFLEAI